MQNGQSSQRYTHQQEGATTTPMAANGTNGNAKMACAAARVGDFNNIHVRKAYKATINSSHIELQSALLGAESTGVFFAREVFDELLAIAVNYKDKNAIGAIAQAAIRESVQSSDVLRFQEILFLLCAGRPETAEGRGNLMLACVPEALHSADAAILAALLRYKIVPAWDIAECGDFELVCEAIARSDPAPDIARPTVQGLAWIHRVCTKDTEDLPDRLELIACRFAALLRACEQRGGAPGQLAAVFRGVGQPKQLAKMCVKHGAQNAKNGTLRPAATPK